MKIIGTKDTMRLSNTVFEWRRLIGANNSSKVLARIVKLLVLITFILLYSAFFIRWHVARCEQRHLIRSSKLISPHKYSIRTVRSNRINQGLTTTNETNQLSAKHEWHWWYSAGNRHHKINRSAQLGVRNTTTVTTAPFVCNSQCINQRHQLPTLMPLSYQSTISNPTVDLSSAIQNARKTQHYRRQVSERHSETSSSNWMVAAISSINIQCRTEWGLELPFELYILDTCARCYHYMPETAFKPDSKFTYLPFGMLTHAALNVTLPANETIKLSSTFSSSALIIKWQQCCTDAILCCINYHKKFNYLHQEKTNRNLSMSRPSWATQNLCPPTWDGWLCWDDFAKPNQILERACPKHIYWHQLVPPCRGYVTKMCNASSHWYVNQDNKEWSNYTMCARDDIYARRIQYSLVTNVIAICALIPALIIFSHYKQLSSLARIRLHKHLFSSLLLHAIIGALLKWHLLHSTIDRSADFDSNAFPQQQQPLPQPQLLNSSPVLKSVSDSTPTRLPSLCLVLSVLLRYFRSTNYLWMFNEALYLHQLIKNAFTQPSLRPLIILAYSLPFVTTVSYIFARYFGTTSSIFSIEEAVENSVFDLNAHIESQTFPNQLQRELPLNENLAAAQTLWLGKSQLHSYHQQLSDSVHHALFSFIQLPSIRSHLAPSFIQESYHRGSSFRSADLWPPDRGVNLAAERLVADQEWVSHKSTTRTPQPQNQESNTNANQPLLDNIEILEDSSPLLEDDHCWLMPSYESWHEWIINVPNLAILLINCFFLVWLLRVLYVKAAASMGGHHNSRNNHQQQGSATSGATMAQPTSPIQASSPIQQPNGGMAQYGHNNRQTHQPQASVFSRQSILVSLRAAVLLLPLYGLHYLVIVYRPKIENCWLSETYHYLSLSLDGLQGLAVSILFCFGNGEIRRLITRSLQRVSTRQRSTTIYMTELAPTGH